MELLYHLIVDEVVWSIQHKIKDVIISDESDFLISNTSYYFIYGLELSLWRRHLLLL
jgi:hypothetical protein